MQKLIKSKAAESISSPPLVMEVAQEFVLFGEDTSSSPKSSSPVVTPQVFDSSRNPCPPQQEPAPAIPQHHKKRFDKRTLTSLFLHHHGGGSGGDSSVHPPQNHHQSLLRRASITSFTSGSSTSGLLHQQSSLEKKGPRLLTSMFIHKKHSSSHHGTEPLPHPTHRSATLGIPSSTTTRRRRSIAITDDAYDNALRMAKSHLDLSLDTLSATSSPLIGKKNKLSLKDRSWGELEKLLSRHKDKETTSTSHIQSTQNNPLPSYSSLSSSPAEVKKVKRNKAAGRSKTYPTRKSDEEFFTSPVFEKLKDENRVYSEDDILKDGEQIGKKVGRAQSCKLEKEQPKSRASNRERRKHSDPNIPRQTSSDVEGGGGGVGVGGGGSSGANPSQAAISNQPSGSSSTSSLSARSSLDSPAGSLQEMVSSSNPNSNLSTSSRGGGSNNGSGGGVPPPPPPPLPPSDSSITSSNHNSQHPPFWDSDFETEPDPPDWRFSMNQEDLVKLKPKEKKRQDVINEFFHTERSHVRNLKVLDRIFYRRMLDNPSLMSEDMVQKLFPNLDKLIQIHTKFNQIMKDRIKSQGFPIGDISDLFLEMFDGPNGDSLIELGSEFTQNQKFTIEELKKKRARDHKFDAFLSDLERRPECRRLGLESILPVEHQRLVKYPLLLEQLSKQTPEDSSYSTIKNCVERTKFILDSIDKRVAEAQNLQRLAEIQKNLDTSGLEKNPESSIPAEYKNCDLTKHRLIYDGPLTLKLGDTRRFKTVDLHVVLLEDCIMLLQKQDDKYLLKFHTSGAASSTGDKKFFHSPIIEFSTMLVRPVATDKRAFYLLNITQTVPQIYELVASSSADRSQWFRHITEASNAYRARDNRRNFRTTGGISPLPDTGSNNNNRETSSTNGLTSSTSVDNTRKDSSSLLGVKGILPAGRSHSFHESSSSSRESPPERQPSSPPEDITKGDCSVNEGAGGGSGSTTPRKRLQRVEILKIAEPSPLIDPSQVVVTQGEILVADPVLTPIEKLRRKDLEISKALLEKQRIIADIFQIPTDDFDAIADIASQPSQNKDAREVLLAALAQANSLSELLNESLNLTEEDTIAASSSSSSNSKSYQANRNLPFFQKAIQKSSNINEFLTSLLAIFQMREEERDRSRHCLQRYQDQIDVYLSDSTTCPVVRPVSFISVEENSSGIQDSEEDEEKRAEKSQSTNQSVSLDIAANVEGVLVSESSNPNSGERALLEDSIDRKFQIEEEEAEGGNESDGSLSPQEGEGVRLLPETNDVVIKTEDEDHTKCLTNPAMEETSSSTGDSPKNETEQSDEP